MEEIWKEYKTHKTHFKVSNMGNVEVIKWNTCTDLDNVVTVYRDGRRCIGSKEVFRLVWEAFNGPIPKKHVIHHIDHNKLNDRLDNLTLMTISEHTKHHHKDKVCSEETKRKMSDAHKNKSGYWKDKKFSEEHKNKLSSAHLGLIEMNNGIDNKMFNSEIEAFVFGYFFKGRIKKED